ncbi:hypothetical protein KJ673_03710 [Patescibacteria group bacterium]|nr:hypothetical protein [Patescibacteria group bacterium]
MKNRRGCRTNTYLVYNGDGESQNWLLGFDIAIRVIHAMAKLLDGYSVTMQGAKIIILFHKKLV